MTRLATGQMQEETQELLDEYNELYNWEYNDMCDFIENHSEEDFREYYETYDRLCADYDKNLVDEFIENYDTDAIEHFEECIKVNMIVVQIAEMIASDCGYVYSRYGRVGLR